ncbi:MAG: hypothetical protein J0G29_00265 [Alphaproteobacteria bacterium]|nr:hypothetical protein [Alphaproteobacteria bacterium]OJV47630.1 MAG: hypothetical protein BGO28_07320 [Alphaproteobacteria bacterium 43-37]
MENIKMIKQTIFAAALLVSVSAVANTDAAAPAVTKEACEAAIKAAGTDAAHADAVTAAKAALEKGDFAACAKALEVKKADEKKAEESK